MVIADTGFWLALANRNDRYHLRATRLLAECREPLITTWPVMTESCHLLLTRLGSEAQARFMDAHARESWEVFELEKRHRPRIAELMRRYQKLPMDLADASLVVLAEELGHGRIFSTDRRDFETYRFKQRQPFENLLLGSEG